MLYLSMKYLLVLLGGVPRKTVNSGKVKIVGYSDFSDVAIRWYFLSGDEISIQSFSSTMQADQHSGPRVVHVTTVHEPFDPRILPKQLHSLRGGGFDARLLAPHHMSEEVHDVPIHALPKPTHRGDRLALQPTVFRRALALDAALYQVHDPELLPCAFLLKKATGARTVYDMHEDYRTKGRLTGRTLRLLERWAFHWVDHVLLAEESYCTIVQGTGVEHTFLPNYFRPLEDRGESSLNLLKDSVPPSRLLYTGTIAAARGLNTMVDMASDIKQANRQETVEMVGICHHAGQRDSAEARIRRERLGGVIERTGWDRYVRPSNMLPHYKRADVGLVLFEPHPNYKETLPTKFFEYLHYGLPIICSDFPLWRRFVERHDCGVTVPPNDPAAVFGVLDAWRADPERYRQCVANARTAAQEYRWAAVEDRLLSVYRRLLNEGD